MNSRVPCKKTVRIPNFYAWIGVKTDKHFVWAWVKNSIHDDLNDGTCWGFFLSGQLAKQLHIKPEVEVKNSADGHRTIQSEEYKNVSAIGITESGYKGFRAVFIPFEKCSIPLDVKNYKKPSRQKQYPDEDRVSMIFRPWFTTLDLRRNISTGWKKVLIEDVEKVLLMSEESCRKYVQSITEPQEKKQSFCEFKVRIDRPKADSLMGVAKGLNMSRAKLLNLLLFNALQRELTGK